MAGLRPVRPSRLCPRLHEKLRLPECSPGSCAGTSLRLRTECEPRPLPTGHLVRARCSRIPVPLLTARPAPTASAAANGRRHHTHRGETSSADARLRRSGRAWTTKIGDRRIQRRRTREQDRPFGTPVGLEPVACRATRNWLICASTRSARQAEPMLDRAERIASEAGALMAFSQSGSRRRGMTAY
jgi:hypothetical protein